MALTRTTLAGAIGPTDIFCGVAAAAGFAVNDFLRLDDEFVLVQSILGTRIGIERGQHGTIATGHALACPAVVGHPEDFPPVPEPRTYTYGASANAIIAPGLHRLYGPGPAAITITLPDPTIGQDGIMMTFMCMDAVAHVVTNAAGSGFNAAGAGADVCTFGAVIGNNITIVADNGNWNVLGNVGGVLA